MKKLILISASVVFLLGLVAIVAPLTLTDKAEASVALAPVPVCAGYDEICRALQTPTYDPWVDYPQSWIECYEGCEDQYWACQDPFRQWVVWDLVLCLDCCDDYYQPLTPQPPYVSGLPARPPWLDDE